MLDLLWRSVNLLLALLGAASEAKDEMEGRLFLDVVVGEGTAVFELLASEDQTLLVGRNSFLVLCGMSVMAGKIYEPELRTYLESCS